VNLVSTNKSQMFHNYVGYHTSLPMYKEDNK